MIVIFYSSHDNILFFPKIYYYEYINLLYGKSIFIYWLNFGIEIGTK
jgi:hypothetical protein